MNSEAIPSDWIAAIQQWAAPISPIQRVYAFGSRARGDNTPTSDLDIAVIVRSNDPNESDLVPWADEGSDWLASLQEVLPVAVHLQCGNEAASPTIVAPAIAEHGILLFVRGHDDAAA